MGSSTSSRRRNISWTNCGMGFLQRRSNPLLKNRRGERRKRGTPDITDELVRRMRSRSRGKKPAASSLID